MQGISPGLVRTEFRGRLLKAEDLEASKKEYDTLCDNVGRNPNLRMRVYIATELYWFIWLFFLGSGS